MDTEQPKSSAASRIDQILAMFGFANPYALERGTGVKRASIQKALRNNKIGKILSQQLASALGLNPIWVESGFGPVMLDGDKIAKECSVSAHTGCPVDSDPYAYAYIRKAKAHLSAGGGIIPEEEFEDQRYAFIRSWLKTVATSESACILMEIDGDSMRPTLESGDMVLVDQGRQELISDGIYAFGEGDVINIKRLQRMHPLVRIVSDNPDRDCYPSREVDPATIRIIGRVIWFARQLR